MVENAVVNQAELAADLQDKLRTDSGARDMFCECWPCTKKVLELLLKLRTLPKRIAEAIKVIVAVGDGVSGVVCK